MASFRTILLWMFISIIFCSCKAPASIFDYSKHINGDFFKNINSISDNSNCPLDSAVAVQVYRAVLSEKLIEKDDVLELTMLNNSSKVPYANYNAILGGYKQELYIFRLVTADGPTNACIYLPVRYGTGNGDCIGFGSAYFGCINRRQTKIDFFSEIRVQKKGQSFSLVKLKHVDMTFFPDKIPEPGIEFVDINKIIFSNINKFGGSKPVVFNIAEVFHDPLALRFNYRETIQLKNPRYGKKSKKNNKD